MFGEGDSESPRVPSPWSNLISTPPSPAHGPVAEGILIPKLVQEAEDGNIEYKLQLLNPSPARFARLVTQLKWRLLEGGGQAYYELGVADSGALIGLPRAELEMTLETLEMMAGEIGASVIVVKEIEVPEVMARLRLLEEGAGGGLTYRNWSGDRAQAAPLPDSETSTTLSEDDSNTGAETEPTADTDVDDPPCTLVKHSSADSLDAFANDASDTPIFTIDLEISLVYKPLPMRRRAHMTLAPPRKQKGRKYLLPASDPDAEQKPIPTKLQEKAALRRLARDRRREERNAASRALAGVDGGSDAHRGIARQGAARVEAHVQATVHEQQQQQARALDHDVEDLTLSLAALHASVCIPPVPVKLLPAACLDAACGPVTVAAAPTVHSAAPLVAIEKEAVPYVKPEPRLVVEALVVRKMSLEEGFLNFEGFC